VQRVAAGNPECANWDWDEERRAIERMAYDFINKHAADSPELVDQLPERLRDSWHRRVEAGHEHVKVSFFPSSGWCVRSRGLVNSHDNAALEGMAASRSRGPADGDEALASNRSSSEEATSAATSKLTKRADPVFILRPRGLIVPSQIPPREWLGGGRHYQRRTVCLTAAPGDFGKTSLATVEAVSMQTARNLLGEQPDEKLRVWYHNGEETRSKSWTSASPPSASTTTSRWRRSPTSSSPTRKWFRCAWPPATASSRSTSP
jgi:hypothetical protein